MDPMFASRILIPSPDLPNSGCAVMYRGIEGVGFRAFRVQGGMDKNMGATILFRIKERGLFLMSALLF